MRGVSPQQATIEELGITYDQSSQWQSLADVPEEDFEAALAGPAKPTMNGIVQAHKQQKKKKQAPPDKDVPKLHPHGLWLWGRLRDFDRNVTDQLQKLKPYEKTLIRNEGLHDNPQGINLISESGLYMLILVRRLEP